MSEHFFGLGPGHLSRKAGQIAEKHGARLTNYTEPNGEKRHWFACRNRVEPFNAATANEVMTALESAEGGA